MKPSLRDQYRELLVLRARVAQAQLEAAGASLDLLQRQIAREAALKKVKEIGR